MTKYLLENAQLTNESDVTEMTLHACMYIMESMETRLVTMGISLSV